MFLQAPDVLYGIVFRMGGGGGGGGSRDTEGEGEDGWQEERLRRGGTRWRTEGMTEVREWWGVEIEDEKRLNECLKGCGKGGMMGLARGMELMVQDEGRKRGFPNTPFHITYYNKDAP